MKKIIVCVLLVFSYVTCSSIKAAEVEGVAADTRLFVFKSIGADFCSRDLGEAYRKAKEKGSVYLEIEEDLSGVGLSFDDVCTVIGKATLTDCSFLLPRDVDLPIDAVLQFIRATINSPRISLSGCQAVNDENVDAILAAGLAKFDIVGVIGCPLSRSMDGMRKLASSMKFGSRLHLSTVTGADGTLHDELTDISRRFNRYIVYTEAYHALVEACVTRVKGTTESMKFALAQALEVLGYWNAGTEINRNTVRSAVKRYANRHTPKIEISGTPGVAKCFDFVYDALLHQLCRMDIEVNWQNNILAKRVKSVLPEFYSRYPVQIDVVTLSEEFPNVTFVKRDMAAIALSLGQDVKSAIPKLMKTCIKRSTTYSPFWSNDSFLYSK
jgi:hypothetical protein